MEKQIGAEGKLKVELVDGKFVFSVDYDGKQVDAGFIVKSETDLVVDAIAAAIPGESTAELAAVALIKAFLKALKV